MKRWFVRIFGVLAASVLCTSYAARAQTPGMPPAMGPSMLRPPQAQDGITVRGVGTATAPATKAQITLNITSPYQAPGGARPAKIDAATLQPLINTLVQTGIARSDIIVPPYLNGGVAVNAADVEIIVHHPNVTMIQQGITALTGVFGSSKTLWLSNAQVRLSVESCASLEQQAQDAAIQAARSNALSIARQLHVKVGGVLSVDVQSNASYPGGECTTQYSLPYQQMPFASPKDYLTVRVFSSVSMRFAIR